METNNQNNDSMFWRGFIDVSTVVIATMLFFKTAEVMTAIAPLTLLGQTGLQVIYGSVVGAMIEGVCLAIHFLKGFRGNVSAQAYKWFLFGVSAFCQFMDRYMVIDVTQQSTQTVEFFKFLTYGIPVAILLGLLLVAQGNASQSVGKSNRKPFRGVRTMWRELLNGSVGKNTGVTVEIGEPQFVPDNLDVEQEVLAKTNHKKQSVGKKVNPTKGKA